MGEPDTSVRDGIISVTYFRSTNAHRGDAECAKKSLKISSMHPLRSQRLCGETANWNNAERC